MVLGTILKTDSYKVSHYLQYPAGTKFVSSYIEGRGGYSDEIVFMGLAPWLAGIKKVTAEELSSAIPFLRAHGFEPNIAGWELMIKRYGGELPVEINALPEGTVVRPGVPVLEIRNTDPDFYWLPSYLETSLLRAIWYMSTVATTSREAKKIIARYLAETSDDPAAEIGFKLHDFGARGVSSGESSALGGIGHLVNFMGTDNLEALVGASMWYGEAMAGFSIPAAEHSTITSWGGPEMEGSAFKNMLEKFPDGLVAVVSDSYNITKAVSGLWGGLLKDRVQRRGERGGCVVIRPDSGDPVTVVRDVITLLMDAFGARTNSKGYKVLPDYVRVIQGDGITLESIPLILEELKAHGISASNVAFGMGGGLLQQCNRDTHKFAMKASEIVVGDETREIYKNPASDRSKASKRGRQGVVLTNGGLEACKIADLGGHPNELRLAFKNGIRFDSPRFDEIRARAAVTI